jgi:hypothetical protein
MRSVFVFTILTTTLVALSSCGPQQSTEERRQAANTPAGKLGQAAHRATVEADKAAQVVGRELKQAAHDARAGWKEDAHKQRDNK